MVTTQNNTMVRRAYGGGVEPQDDGTFVFQISSPYPDRRGDEIVQQGVDFEDYLANPVFLWNHDRHSPPIGTTHEVWLKNGALMARVEFDDKGFGLQVRRLYEKGFMRGVSIGFLPLEYERIEHERGNGYSYYRRRYLRSRLLEISATTVPMHADALIRRSMDSADGDLWLDILYVLENIDKVL